jgi:hypothetical protein
MLHHTWVQNDDTRAVDVNGIHPGNHAPTHHYDGTTVAPCPDAARHWPPNPDGLAWARRIVRRCPAHFGLPAGALTDTAALPA